MAIKTMYDIIEVGYDLTGTVLTNVGTSELNLPTRLFYEDGLSIEHDDGAGTVTPLTGSDYTLSDLDQPLTDLFGKNVYKKLYVTNAAYQSGQITVDFTGVGDYMKSTDMAELQSQIDTKFDASAGGPIESNITVRDILPNMVGATGSVSTRSIGSETTQFNAVYADEVFVGASSLYVNGKKVLEDVADTIEFKTDENQGLALKTTASAPGSGNGNIALQSDNEVNVVAKGGLELTVPTGVASKNVVISTASTNGQVQIAAADEIDLSATTIDINGTIQGVDLILSGDLTVNGTTITLDTETLTIEDNIIVLNDNQTGTPSSSLISGIEVERGDSTNYRFVFTEDDDTFRIGEHGSEQAVATRQDAPASTGVAYWNNTTKRLDTHSGLTYDGTDLIATGDIYSKTRRVVTVASGTSFPGTAGLGDECYRTDLDEWYKYNGTVWTQI